MWGFVRSADEIIQLLEEIDDLIDVLIDYKLDLLFNRQLRIHRENPDFLKYCKETNEVTVEAPVLDHTEAGKDDDATHSRVQRRVDVAGDRPGE